MSMQNRRLRIAIAQIAPVWLDREATLDKVADSIESAASQGARLVAFGEALVPGYPFWIERTDGARFESDLQKTLYARYADAAVIIGRGDLGGISALAAKFEIAVYLGVVEQDPGSRGRSLYCSMVYIDTSGAICSVHRKLMPTYEERLAWAPGDGNGLTTHQLDHFRVGGLNCWENWLPLARASLYGQGEDLHVAIWPGSARNTRDISQFIAREGRCFVLSVSGLMRRSDIPGDLPNEVQNSADDWMADGGSCLVGPDGQFMIEPIVNEEVTRLATIDLAAVQRERQTLDVAGHYSRPDVLQLHINKTRQSTVTMTTPGDTDRNEIDD